MEESEAAVQGRENIYINSEVKNPFTDGLAKYQSEGKYNLVIVLHIYFQKRVSLTNLA